MLKYNKYKEKLFESLPRQSTVDQLKRIREEIKKSQVIKVGPDESTMKGDVGDRVTDDLKKHKNMNNLFYWDNPLDRHIDSYETFIKDDSRGSLGYTKNGDPKIHKGTDYVKESINPLDPYGEEDWDDDYDIIVEKPGFNARHKKGGGVMEWNYEIKIDDYWNYIKGKNIKFRDKDNDKKFYVGLFAGTVMTKEYFEKQK